MIDEAYERSVDVLKRNVTEHGFFGSETVYHDVWARDTVISLLGGALLDDSEIKEACLHSIETLRRYQSEIGQVPNCVSFREEEAKPDYGELYGSAVDASLWYIIGVYYYYVLSNDDGFLSSYYESIRRALFWLRCQDSDGCGLIETQESSGWTDLLSNRGKVLYENVLWHKALLCCSEIHRKLNSTDEEDRYAELAEQVKKKINTLFWCDTPSAIFGPNMAHTLVRDPKYYLSYVTARDFSWRFDSFANILAILFGIAERKRSIQIVEFMIRAGIDQPYPIKALYPPIFPGDKEWREYYVDHHLNLPNHYHNGGIWPFIGGFWVCVLSIMGRTTEAKVALEKLAAANRQGLLAPWEFNEWLHGITGRPMGAIHQTWSAAGYVLAYKIVEQNMQPPLFVF